MNRAEFLQALAAELDNVSEEERAEALKFYDEFLDEAGPADEERVIADLGDPHRVANIIRANLGLPASPRRERPQPKLTLDETPKPQRQPAQPDLTLDGPDWASRQQAQEQAQEAPAQQQAAAPEPEPQPEPSGPAYSGPAYSHPQPEYDYSAQAGRPPLRDSNRTLWIILIVLTFPIWIGLIGGAFGLVFGLLGGVLGIFGGGIGAIASGVGSLIHGIFHLLGSPFNSLVDMGLGLVKIAVGGIMTGAAAWCLGKGVPWVVHTARRLFNSIRGKVGF